MIQFIVVQHGVFSLKGKNQHKNIRELLNPAILQGSVSPSSALFLKEWIADDFSPPLPRDTVSRGTASRNTPPRNTSLPPRLSSWEKSLGLLVNYFMEEKYTLVQLNPGRRKQIEAYINKLGNLSSLTSLDRIITAPAESKEHEGLLCFAQEMAVFQLLQFLVLKRWHDLGCIPSASLEDLAKKLNWQITSYLRKRNKNQLFMSYQWSFLKINIYSWFKPSMQVWNKIIHLTKDINLATASENFLIEMLQRSHKKPFLKKMGLTFSSMYTRLTWELLFKQKQLDEGSEDQVTLGFGEANRTFISGLSGGCSLTSLYAMDPNSHWEGIYGFANSEFEKFISEILLLWAIGLDTVPAVKIEKNDLLFHGKNKSQKNFPFQSAHVPNDIGHILCFPEDALESSSDIKAAIELLPRILENGTLLLASNTYWITDNSKLSESMRKHCLSECTLRLIIDFRHLIFPDSELHGGQPPKCLYILEKHSNREIRDANRPRIIKARGVIADAASLEKLWQLVLDCMDIDCDPGEVKRFSVGEKLQRANVECMSAATDQRHLNIAPWTSLSDPAFYTISSSLKRHPYKIAHRGTLIPPQQHAQMVPSLQRGVCLMELPGKSLYGSCYLSEIEKTYPDYTKQSRQYIFIPDINVMESRAFFAAMINSSPVQFWYRLEWEQNCYGRKRRCTGKQLEMLLKFMPVAQLFSQGDKYPPFQSRGSALDVFPSIDDILPLLDPDSSIEDRLRLHQYILDLEFTTAHHISIVKECAAHLFPDYEISRWHIPEELPDISGECSFQALSHLEQVPLCQHPAFQFTLLKNTTDFKVSSVKIRPLHTGYHELTLYSGSVPMLKVQGSSLLIQTANGAIQRRIGRAWSEISKKVTFPLDESLTRKQISQFVQLTETEIQTTVRAVALLDFIFCRLFHLSGSSPFEGDTQIIRNYLNPENVASLLKTPLFPLDTKELPVRTTGFPQQ